VNHQNAAAAVSHRFKNKFSQRRARRILNHPVQINMSLGGKFTAPEPNDQPRVDSHSHPFDVLVCLGDIEIALP